MKPLALVLLLAILLASCANDPTWEAATNRNLPGKNQPGKCSEYARALYRDMKAKGHKAHILVYVTEPITTQPFAGYPMVRQGIQGHAVCVYYGPGKEVWAMDNQLMRPVMVPDGDANAIARRLAGPERVASMAYFADASEPPVPGWEPGPNYRRMR